MRDVINVALFNGVSLPCSAVHNYKGQSPVKNQNMTLQYMTSLVLMNTCSFFLVIDIITNRAVTLTCINM